MLCWYHHFFSLSSYSSNDWCILEICDRSGSWHSWSVPMEIADHPNTSRLDSDRWPTCSWLTPVCCVSHSLSHSVSHSVTLCVTLCHAVCHIVCSTSNWLFWTLDRQWHSDFPVTQWSCVIFLWLFPDWQRQLAWMVSHLASSSRN